jgi:hypothetical protein
MTLILSGTAGLSDVDGSAATPAIRGTDTNTGIFFPAADTIAFAEGGVEAMRLDSAGNMGLGVTPNTWRTNDKAIQIGGSTDYANIVGTGAGITFGNNFYRDSGGFKYKNSYAAGRFDFDYTASGGFTWNIAPSGTAGNAISFTQAMTLDASGNLGIGNTSPSSYYVDFRNLVVGNGSDNAGITIASGTTRGGTIAFADGTSGNTTYRGYLQYEHNTDAFTIGTAATERMRIDSSGNLLVGKTVVSSSTVGWECRPSGEFSSTMSASTNGTVTNYVYSTGAAAARFYIGMGGTVYATSTTITAISDQRFKENIRDLDDGLDVVMALKPRKFDWKEGKGQDIKDARGFIAQEFEQVLPDMIEEWRDPAPEGEEPYKAINANLIPTLVKAIQELKAEFDAYKLTHP